MTDKEIKSIYKYMIKVWEKGLWNYSLYNKESGEEIKLDSNSAWEVVQEMERKGNWKAFNDFGWDEFQPSSGRYKNLLEENEHFVSDYIFWLMNPENFFNCFAKWLENKENK